jgi:hypothetical protein
LFQIGGADLELLISKFVKPDLAPVLGALLGEGDAFCQAIFQDPLAALSITPDLHILRSFFG